METLEVTVPCALKARLEALANQIGQSLGDCLLAAVQEYVETWESHLADVGRIDDTEARAVLNAVADD